MIKIKKKKGREGINTTSSSNEKGPAHGAKTTKATGKASHLCSDLPHGVPVPQGCSVRGLVHGVKVNGDAESHANLIRPGVASSDGPRGIIHFVGDAVPGQGFRYSK